MQDTQTHTVPLRYPSATLLLSENLGRKVVQGMLGRATISQTMDSYSHLLPDMQDGADAEELTVGEYLDK